MHPRSKTHPEIARDLADRIDAGEYSPGSKLPTYAELCEIYSVHHATIQRAIIVLKAMGYVDGVPGVGVYVRRR